MSGPAVAPVPGVAEDADKFCIRQRLGKLKVPGPEQVAAAFFSVNGIQFRTHRLCQPFGQFDPISEGRAAQMSALNQTERLASSTVRSVMQALSSTVAVN